ncbi:MAG: hypothetical protein GAK28_01195 [Luteibacter sp.]|uniref:hypothetical protein n=1 Tax=Luteibacter sp. TaxID=1886636 RepID=UPI0013846C6C|nr:hypothetical protein [Luteibacter sp.]KAF1008216.1 MAG: hypothetical protein GAK28_01195 [Luteibacter sp.]
MLKKITAPGVVPAFAPWRIVVWLVMLLSAVGFVLNGYAAVIFGKAVVALTPEALANGGPDPRIGLAWSLGYVVGAFIVMALALGTLRWREWGRTGLRIVAVVLLLWAAYTAWVAFDQWRQLGAVLTQPGLPAELLAMGQKHRTILLLGLSLKLVSVPVLGWLAWRLGTLRVREQFGQFAL